MLRLWVVCGVLFCTFVLVYSDSDMGPGKWHVTYITTCEKENDIFKFDITQKKINRTHDGFNADLTLEEDFTQDFGVRVDICKYVDGGCKQVQVLSDTCFVQFADKYAKNNVKACLEIAGVDPPEFPMKKGEYHVTDYEFDYSELPEDGMYGSFCGKAYLLKDTEEVGCVELHMEFKEEEECEDEECDEK